MRILMTSQPSGASYNCLAVFGHDQKPEYDSRDCRVSYDHHATSCGFARRRATPLDAMPRRGYAYNICICSHRHGLLTVLCHGSATSCDII